MSSTDANQRVGGRESYIGGEHSYCRMPGTIFTKDTFVVGTRMHEATTRRGRESLSYVWLTKSRFGLFWGKIRGKWPHDRRYWGETRARQFLMSIPG